MGSGPLQRVVKTVREYYMVAGEEFTRSRKRNLEAAYPPISAHGPSGAMQSTCALTRERGIRRCSTATAPTESKNGRAAGSRVSAATCTPTRSPVMRLCIGRREQAVVDHPCRVHRACPAEILRGVRDYEVADRRTGLRQIQALYAVEASHQGQTNDCQTALNWGLTQFR